MSQAEAAEVAVVGAGPAGAATALALARLGVPRVFLYDGGRRRTQDIGESIPPETRLLLMRLGTWDRFAKAGHAPCAGSRSTWGAAHAGYNDFALNPHGFGWHLDRARFDADLIDEAVAAGVQLRRGRVQGVSRIDENEFIIQADAATVRARCVVDATGTVARIARAQGAERIEHDRFVCVAGFFDLPSHASIPPWTVLEAVEWGWWYAAPLPRRRAIALIATDADIQKTKRLADPDRWHEAFQSTGRVATALRDASFAPESLTVLGVSSGEMSPAAGPGWLAVGDAAATHDPLSSQGIYHALSGGLTAAGSIADWLDGDAAALAEYSASASTHFAEYGAVRDHLYALEQRWPASPFWQRRQRQAAAQVVAVAAGEPNP